MDDAQMDHSPAEDAVGGAADQMPPEPPLTDPCSDALTSLYTYLDGELTDERRGLISRHLDDCHSCLQAHDFEAELRRVVASSCQQQVPDSLRQRIAQQLSSESGLDL